MQELNLADILAQTSDLTEEKSVGYVAVIGRPNTGKSTFINTLIGEKVSITTNVPQTTRKRVLAIYNDQESQVIFFDTPGIHKSEKHFNKKINEVAIKSFQDSDLILYFIDPTREGGEEERYIKGIVDMVNKPVIRVYTKADLPAKQTIPQDENIFSISSTTSIGFTPLMDAVKKLMPIGPLLFPTDIYTKQDMFFRISEIIREKAFLHTKEELPHSIYIGVEEIQDEDKIMKIVAYIYCESDSQKYIVIGKGGSLIQTIGSEARKDLEEIFEKKIFLALRAKVKKNWRKDDRLTKTILH